MRLQISHRILHIAFGVVFVYLQITAYFLLPGSMNAPDSISCYTERQYQSGSECKCKKTFWLHVYDPFRRANDVIVYRAISLGNKTVIDIPDSF